VAKIEHVDAVIALMKRVRQIRQYQETPVSREAIDQLLEIARWTGSARNTQPWRFIVIDDKTILRRISQLRTPINWLAGAPVAIAIALNPESGVTGVFDEGRVSERVLIGANLLGLGGGTAWFGDDAQEAEAKKILGIPEEMIARSVIAIGHPITSKDPRPNPAQGGRKPLSEIVGWNRYGPPR
jgi:nitroreductase